MTLFEIFANSRVECVTIYDTGFVPNSYKYPAPGVRRKIYRNGCVVYEQYDRKRSHGRGPAWVAQSERGGRLLSGRSSLEHVEAFVGFMRRDT